MAMAFDLGDQSSEHLSMILESCLIYYGLPTKLYKAKYQETPYDEIGQLELEYPDESDPPSEEEEDEPIDIQVLIADSIESLVSEPDMISYSDKVQEEFTIVTSTSLNLDDRLDITFPGNRVMRVRITRPTVVNPYSQTLYSAVGVVL